MARFGYTSDLSPKERRDMARFNRGLAVTRGKNKAKRFLKENGPLIAAGVVAVMLLYFRKELKETIGGSTVGGLTP